MNCATNFDLSEEELRDVDLTLSSETALTPVAGPSQDKIRCSGWPLNLNTTPDDGLYMCTPRVQC